MNQAVMLINCYLYGATAVMLLVLVLIVYLRGQMNHFPNPFAKKNLVYILMLVAKYHDSNCEDKEILVDICKAVDSSMQLRSKKDLIENFIATVNTATKVDDDWIKFVTEQKKTDLDTLIAEEKLKPDETRKFVDNSFRDGILKTTGTDVDRILPPVSRFGGGNRAAKKDGIIAKLQAFFDKYFGLV